MKKYNYVLDFDTIEELHTGEVEAKSIEQARAKILDMVSISILPAEGEE